MSQKRVGKFQRERWNKGFGETNITAYLNKVFTSDPVLCCDITAQVGV